MRLLYGQSDPTGQHFLRIILMSDPPVKTSGVLCVTAAHSFASQRDHGSHLSDNDFPCFYVWNFDYRMKDNKLARRINMKITLHADKFSTWLEFSVPVQALHRRQILMSFWKHESSSVRTRSMSSEIFPPERPSSTNGLLILKGTNKHPSTTFRTILVL